MQLYAAYMRNNLHNKEMYCNNAKYIILVDVSGDWLHNWGPDIVTMYLYYVFTSIIIYYITHGYNWRKHNN